MTSPASPSPSPRPGAFGRQTVWLTYQADSLLLQGCILLKKKITGSQMHNERF